MDLQVRRLFAFQKRRQVGEGRIERIARRRRDHRQRKSLGEHRIAGGGLARRSIRRQRIDALAPQRLRIELALARGRRKVALRKRRELCRHVEPLPSLLPEGLPIEPLGARVRRDERMARDVLVAFAKAALLEPHSFCQEAEYFGVRLRFAHRCDRRIVGEDVQVSVRRMHVDVLELRRRWEHDVRVVGGIGQEHVVDHAEEVLARKSGDDLHGLGGDRDRVGVVNVDRANRRIVLVEQRVADGRHVDRARIVPDEIGPLERLVVDRVGAARREQGAARRIAPGADQRGEAGRGAHRHAAAGVPLHPIVEPDHRGLDRAVVPRQRNDVVGCETGDLRDAPRRVIAQAFHELLETQRVTRDVVVIEQVFRDEDVHHAQRQRGIGARQRREVHVTLLRGLAAVGIDRDQLGAAAFRLLHAAPQVQVRDDGIRAPDDDELGVFELFEIGADARPDGRGVACLARARAYCAIEQRCAEPVKKAPIHGAVLEQAHCPGVAVGKNCLRSIRRSGDLLEARADRVQRFVPADALEATGALRADAPQRMQHALRCIRAIEIARDLRAQRTARGRMIGGAFDLDRAAVLHRDEQRTGIGTIVRTRAANDGARRR